MATRKHTAPPAARGLDPLQELEKQLPFRNKRSGGYIAGRARSTTGGYEAGTLAATAYLKFAREYSKLGYAGVITRLLEFVENVVYAKEPSGPTRMFAFGFFSQLEIQIARAARSFGDDLDAENFESLGERIEKRLALTETEASREARSRRSKEAWARKRGGVSTKDQQEVRP